MPKLLKTEEIVVNLSMHRSAAKTLMILGSGWNHVVGEMQVDEEFRYEDIFGVGAGVAGHEGKLFLGDVEGQKVWVMAGRFHTYEGYSAEEVTRPIQAFKEIGVEQVVVTSASGGLNENFQVGDIVVISDVIALFCKSPLSGATFQDLSKPFDDELREKVIRFCESNQIPFFQKEGVYAYVRGPHYESFSDKKALRTLGADCVGMSSVPETIMGNFLGLKMLGLSCVTNLAFVKHDHKDVVAAAEAVSENMVKVLKAVVVS